jgi:hypothetical protein
MAETAAHLADHMSGSTGPPVLGVGSVVLGVLASPLVDASELVEPVADPLVEPSVVGSLSPRPPQASTSSSGATSLEASMG